MVIGMEQGQKIKISHALATGDLLHSNNDNVTENGISFIETAITYDEFFCKFLMPNKPCIFGNWITDHWRSVGEWSRVDGRPNFEQLDGEFGHAVVPVANCDKVEYQAQPKQDMQLSEYLAYWKEYITAGYCSPRGCLYLKDWHFTRYFPDYDAYTTPVFFRSDWLNEYWDQRPDSTDDYRFVYMGPKNSWTPFHADVLRSYSWSANVCGKKRWLLLPPGEEEFFRDTLGNLAYDLTSSDVEDPKKFPDRHRARAPVEVIQEVGQVIFVPSGWHHQVFNLEDTISVNHNWLNGCNVGISWRFLQAELRLVQKSIEDCRSMDGWEQQCQLILKASTGIDYAEFYNFLQIIASHRLCCLSTMLSSTHKKSSRDECQSFKERNIETDEQCSEEGGEVQRPVNKGDSESSSSTGRISASVGAFSESMLQSVGGIGASRRRMSASVSGIAGDNCEHESAELEHEALESSHDLVKTCETRVLSHVDMSSREQGHGNQSLSAAGGSHHDDSESNGACVKVNMQQHQSKITINQDDAGMSVTCDGRSKCIDCAAGHSSGQHCPNVRGNDDNRDLLKGHSTPLGLLNANGEQLSMNHWLHDLWRIQQLLEEMVTNQEFLDCNFSHFSESPHHLIEKICVVLDE